MTELFAVLSMDIGTFGLAIAGFLVLIGLRKAAVRLVMFAIVIMLLPMVIADIRPWLPLAAVALVSLCVVSIVWKRVMPRGRR